MLSLFVGWLAQDQIWLSWEIVSGPHCLFFWSSSWAWPSWQRRDSRQQGQHEGSTTKPSLNTFVNANLFRFTKKTPHPPVDDAFCFFILPVVNPWETIWLKLCPAWDFCASQPSMVHWLSSSIFPCSVGCLVVWLSRYGNTLQNLTSSCPTP